MLSNILADIRAFLFVMLLVVIMFGHALFMVLGTRDEGVVVREWPCQDGDNEQHSKIDSKSTKGLGRRTCLHKVTTIFICFFLGESVEYF